MSNRRKRTASNIKQAPNNIPFYHSHPQYGYMPPPVYNQAYTHPIPVYPSSDYIFIPINEYGQIVGPPTEFPPIFNPYYPEPQSHFERMSHISARGSYIHPPRRDRMLYDDYHSHPNSHRSYEKSRREVLPPINRHVFIFFIYLLKTNFSFFFLIAIFFNSTCFTR